MSSSAQRTILAALGTVGSRRSGTWTVAAFPASLVG